MNFDIPNHNNLYIDVSKSTSTSTYDIGPRFLGCVQHAITFNYITMRVVLIN